MRRSWCFQQAAILLRQRHPQGGSRTVVGTEKGTTAGYCEALAENLIHPLARVWSIYLKHTTVFYNGRRGIKSSSHWVVVVVVAVERYWSDRKSPVSHVGSEKTARNNKLFFLVRLTVLAAAVTAAEVEYSLPSVFSCWVLWLF